MTPPSAWRTAWYWTRWNWARLAGRLSSASSDLHVESLSDRERGRLGEDRAVAKLRADGCRIVGRNRRVAGVEIDVLAEDPNEQVLLVVEVKASGDGRPPERRVDVSRRRRLVRAATRLGLSRRVAIEVIAVDLRSSDADAVRRIRLEPADLEFSPRQRGR